jgi:hypothetical protein
MHLGRKANGKAVVKNADDTEGEKEVDICVYNVCIYGSVCL